MRFASQINVHGRATLFSDHLQGGVSRQDTTRCAYVAGYICKMLGHTVDQHKSMGKHTMAQGHLGQRMLQFYVWWAGGSA
jgi:hypothetical protein